MDGSADDLKRRFLDRVEAAKRATKIDADLGKALWWMLVTDSWFINQLERYAIAVVGKWRGNEEDAKDLMQDVVLALHEEILDDPVPCRCSVRSTPWTSMVSPPRSAEPSGPCIATGPASKVTAAVPNWPLPLAKSVQLRAT